MIDIGSRFQGAPMVVVFGVANCMQTFRRHTTPKNAGVAAHTHHSTLNTI